jgi:hypothetical protein
MDTIRNPFAPGAGTPPPELSGREAFLLRTRQSFKRVQAGKSEKGLVMVGLRGVGKTVLLNEMREQAKTLGFRNCAIEAHEGKSLPALLVPQLRRILLELDRIESLNEHVKRALRVLKSFMNGWKTKIGDVEISMDIDPEPGAADSGDIEADLPDLMAAIGRAARHRDAAIGLFIDEIQYFSASELSALIMAMHRLAQEQLPVIMIAAGLPQLIALFGTSKSYAERLFDFPEIGPLNTSDAYAALVKPALLEGIEFSTAALEEIFAQTSGYPFFLQEWGYHVWNVSPKSPITRADAEAATDISIKRLDQGFFRVRFDRLTPREKNYLRAMAEIGPGPHRTGAVAKQLGKSSSALGTLRDGLIHKGMIYAPSYGEIAFTVPLFDDFLLRMIPKGA